MTQPKLRKSHKDGRFKAKKTMMIAATLAISWYAVSGLLMIAANDQNRLKITYRKD
jgi:hypothetical protein